MINRKKKLRYIQIFFFLASVSILYYSYSEKFNPSDMSIISKELENKIEKQITNDEDGDKFYNVTYSGLDLSGNRYILKAKEAQNNEEMPQKIFMKKVEALFYFKDETVLEVWANEAIYDNKTLDIIFNKNIKAQYEDSKLYAENAEFSNSKSFLTITEKVRVNDDKGNLMADKLLFDLKKQVLNIIAFDNKKINTNINLK